MDPFEVSAEVAVSSYRYWLAQATQARQERAAAWQVFCRAEVSAWRHIAARALAAEWTRVVAVCHDRAPLVCGEVA
jgi:U3 small nucleolar RNA-associated protein 14